MLPATPKADQYWPGAWTMGNLGRPGYPATSDGTWPYSCVYRYPLLNDCQLLTLLSRYDECDVGTFPKQLEKGETGPPGALQNGRGGWEQYQGRLSALPGQRLRWVDKVIPFHGDNAEPSFVLPSLLLSLYSACTCPDSDHPGPWGKFDGSDVERYRGRGAPEIDIIEIQHDDHGPGIVASQSAQFAPFTHAWNFDEVCPLPSTCVRI